MRTRLYIPKDVRLLLFLAVGLNLGRILVFRSEYFTYLFWNIFLALLPFIISSLLLWYEKKGILTKLLFFIGGIVWILVLPNAPYVVTDLIHLGPNHGAPILYDVFLLFSSAWVGLLLGMHSILQMEKIITERYSPRIASIKVPIILILVSVGMYIGRYLRFNSWDIFADRSFFGDTMGAFSHPVSAFEAITFIVSCFFFLYISYHAWKSSRGEPPISADTQY